MYLYIYIYVNICIYICIYIYVFICIYMCMTTTTTMTITMVVLNIPCCVSYSSFLCPEEDCQSLLEHLLHEVPEMRPTAAEALQHPWFDAEHSVSGGYMELHSVITHTYLHTYIPTYIPAYLHIYIPAYLHTYVPTYIPS